MGKYPYLTYGYRVSALGYKALEHVSRRKVYLCCSLVLKYFYYIGISKSLHHRGIVSRYKRYLYERNKLDRGRQARSEGLGFLFALSAETRDLGFCTPHLLYV